MSRSGMEQIYSYIRAFFFVLNLSEIIFWELFSKANTAVTKRQNSNFWDESDKELRNVAVPWLTTGEPQRITSGPSDRILMGPTARPHTMRGKKRLQKHSSNITEGFSSFLYILWFIHFYFWNQYRMETVLISAVLVFNTFLEDHSKTLKSYKTKSLKDGKHLHTEASPVESAPPFQGFRQLLCQTLPVRNI